MAFEGIVEAWDISGRATGIASGRPGEVPRFQTVKFTRDPKEPLLDIATRAMKFAAERLYVVKPGAVFIEAPIQSLFQDVEDEKTGERKPMSNSRTKIILIGLWFGIGGLSGARRIHTKSVAVSTVRKYFLGAGNIPKAIAKPRAMERCRLLGWDPDNYDESDAGALWAYGVNQLRPDLAPRTEPLFLGEP